MDLLADGQDVGVEPSPGTLRSRLGAAEYGIMPLPVPAAHSFEDIFRTEYAGVVRVVRGLGVPVGEAEDVAQSVFMVLNRRLGSYDPARPIRAWLFGIARRVVGEYFRSRRRAAARERDRHPTATAPEDPEALAERIQAISLVERILASMKEEWRLPFILAEIEGHTAPEIAEMLGWKVATVYTRLRRARAHFEAERTRLQDEVEAHG